MHAKMQSTAGLIPQAKVVVSFNVSFLLFFLRIKQTLYRKGKEIFSLMGTKGSTKLSLWTINSNNGGMLWTTCCFVHVIVYIIIGPSFVCGSTLCPKI